jgi:hypothetical protein
MAEGGASPPAAGRRSLALLPWVALAAALAIAWLPLAVPEVIAGHSSMSDRIRSEAIHAAVAGGDLLPAWLPDLYDRHGTPLPSFYSPLTYGVVELFRSLTGSPEAAYKLTYLFFWIVGSAGAAQAARLRFGAGAGIPAAAAFALAPYTLVDAYVRSGIAEFGALALLPWMLVALAARGTAARTGTALGVAALVLTHNITSLIAAPVLALLALLGPRAVRRRGLEGVALGLVLSVFYWLPALVEKSWLWPDSNLTKGFFDYQRHFVAALDLLPWRTSLHFTVGPSSGLAFRLGELLLLPLIAVLALAIVRRSRPCASATLLAAASATALVLTSALSEPIWRVLPLARFVQFPFRLFLFATVLAVPLVGWLVVQAPARWRPLFAALVAAAALLIAQPWIEARYFFIDRTTKLPIPVLETELAQARRDPRFLPAASWVTLDRLRSEHWSSSPSEAFLPRTVTALPSTPTGEVPSVAAEALGEGVRVVTSDWGYPEVRAEIEVQRAGEVALHQFWFPGWRATADGESREIRAEPGRGRLLVAVRPGDRHLRARFGPTPLRRATTVLSGMALLAWMGVVLLPSLSRRRNGPGRPGTGPVGEG